MLTNYDYRTSPTTLMIRHMNQDQSIHKHSHIIISHAYKPTEGSIIKYEKKIQIANQHSNQSIHGRYLSESSAIIQRDLIAWNRI